MRGTTAKFIALGLAASSFLALYWPVATQLVRDWAHDDNYSHGFVIVPLALYFAWERRGRLAGAAERPSLQGLVLVLAGLALLLVGRLGAETFTTRLSLLVVLTGVLIFLRGWTTVRILMFPLVFLLLMIPLPAIVFNQIAFPLQLMASWAGQAGLVLMRIPVLREGNLIILPRTTLEVAEACSGIRSLISLLTLGIVYGYFLDGRASVRALIAISTVPIAVLANGFRVAGTGIAASYFGDAAAQGFFHTFSGWLVFIVAFGMLFAVAHVILRAGRSVPPAAFSTGT